MALTRTIGLFVVVVLATGAVRGGDLAGIGQPPAPGRTSSSSWPTIWATATSASTARPTRRRPTSTVWRPRASRFTDFYANAPVCTPTRAGLITGRYQQRVMLERPLSTFGPTAEARLPVTGHSLPKLMGDAGYSTALIGKWHLGFTKEAGPRAHGFGYFWGYLSGYLDWYAHVRGDGQPDLWENESPTTHRGYFHHETTRRAIRFIEQHKAEPFFLDLSYGAPHWPFQSPTTPSVAKREDNSMMQQPSDDNAPTRADYVAIMEDFDREIGEVLDAIRVQGLDGTPW